MLLMHRSLPLPSPNRNRNITLPLAQPIRPLPSSRHIPVLPHQSQRSLHASSRSRTGVVGDGVIEDLSPSEGGGGSDGGGVAVGGGGRREHGEEMGGEEGEEEGR